MILWRPVGFHEMAKVFEAGMKGFPPRLPEQSIFYPVLVQEYADQTAATWNTKEEPFVGYVIEMEILDEYGARFSHKQSVQLSIVSCGCLRRNSQSSTTSLQNRSRCDVPTSGRSIGGTCRTSLGFAGQMLINKLR